MIDKNVIFILLLVSLFSLLEIVNMPKCFGATYEPIEFNSSATYGSQQWQIDRANWNIINNNKYSTYQVDKEREDRVNYDKYIESKLTTEQNNRVNMDKSLQSQINTNNNQSIARDKRLENKIEMNRQSITDLKQTDTTLLERTSLNSEKISKQKELLNQTNTRVQNNSRAIDSLNQRVNKLDDRLEKGLATVTALTALHPNPRSNSKTQIAIGAGFYADNTAGAIGVFHWVNDRVMLNAGASYGGSDSWAGNVGISIGF